MGSIPPIFFNGRYHQNGGLTLPANVSLLEFSGMIIEGGLSKEATASLVGVVENMNFPQCPPRKLKYGGTFLLSGHETRLFGTTPPFPPKKK